MEPFESMEAARRWVNQYCPRHRVSVLWNRPVGDIGVMDCHSWMITVYSPLALLKGRAQ